MRRIALIIALWLGLLLSGASAGNYELTDGSHVTGDPLGYDDIGVLLKGSDGSYSERIPWGKFSDDALRQLRDDAKNPHDRAIVDPMVSDDTPAQKAKFRDITVTPVVTPERATGHLGILAIFTNPLGWFMLLILYGASIYAAYEIAVFRNLPMQTVCGLAAIPFVGVATSLFFLSQRTQPRADDQAVPPTNTTSAPLQMPPMGAAGQHSPLPPESAPPPAPRNQAAAPSAPVRPSLPAPIVFSRGDFSFNRRFFETKMPGFFRVVLSDADKDLLIHIKSSRGDFVGKRIARITPTELYLQLFKDEVSSEEMIPFGEISEVQIRHKDLPES